MIADLSLSVIRDRVALPMFALALAAGLALALNANLTPWRLAADLVVAMQNGRPLNPPAGLEMRDGVPYRYQGVAIFINGYPEFRDQ